MNPRVSPHRLHADWGLRGCSETPGCSSRSPPGLWGHPPPRGSSAGWQTDHDPPSPASDSCPGCPALLQHQTGRPCAYAQTFPGTAGGQSLIQTQTAMHPDPWCRGLGGTEWRLTGNGGVWHLVFVHFSLHLTITFGICSRLGAAGAAPPRDGLREAVNFCI